MSQAMMTPTRIVRRLPVDNKADVLVDDQDLNHIIAAIKHYHKLHQPEFDNISEEFWQGNAKDTAKSLFGFLKKYVPYDPEPEHDQTIKRPGRFIQDAFDGTCKKNDCKHYASFICGVIDSLDRKGYPIHCNYRFVSDIPGKDVHHVFAVVRDQGGEYWVDPVLSSFDQRPEFHNTKDIAFSHGIGRLTYLSGTDADAAMGLSFKKAWEGIKHGAQVNLQNAGKGIKKAVQDVKHVALKVAVAPARNAVLALLDINAFNLATRFSNALKGPKSGQLQDTWRKMGGDPAKLAQAARNGLLFKAKLHHKDPKAVHGFGNCIGMGATYHSDLITTHPHRWIRDHWMPKHRRHMHKMRNSDGTYNMAMIRGSMVGVEPVSTASLMALASGLLAVLGKYLDMHHSEAAAMADEAKQGTGIIADQAAAADAAEGQYKADQMTAITQPPTGGDASMSVKTGLDDAGQPQVTVDDVRHPALNNAGGPGGGAAADQQPDAPAEKSFITDIEDKAKTAWKDHKKLIIGVGVVFLLSMNKSVMKKFGFK